MKKVVTPGNPNGSHITLTFARFIDPGFRFPVPGAPFLLVALFLLSGFGLAWRVTRRRADPAPQPASSPG